MNHAEHDLQTKINQTQREVILVPHLFFGIDRSQRTGRATHIRQKARGLIAGTSDTVLLCPGLPAMIIELKARGKQVDAGDKQDRFGAAVTSSGHLWAWVDSVFDYFQTIERWGAPLRSDWHLIAENRDLLLLSAAIKREEAKTGVPSKLRRSPSLGRVKKAEAIRGRVPF